MLLEIMVAALIGLSFGNAWTCIFMSFGTSSEQRSVGKWFIIGRVLGLIILGSLISLLRLAAQEIMPIVLLIFGATTVLFGASILIKQYSNHRSSKGHDSKIDTGQVPNKSIMMALLSLLIAGNTRYEKNRKKASIISVSDQPQGFKGYYKVKHRGECKRKGKTKSKFGGFSLGVLRGLTPCVKVIVLAPLLVAFGLPSSLLIILVYALTSTIYPVIGYLSADALSKFERHQGSLRIVGALILIAVGIYTLWKMVMWGSIHNS